MDEQRHVDQRNTANPDYRHNLLLACARYERHRHDLFEQLGDGLLVIHHWLTAGGIQQEQPFERCNLCGGKPNAELGFCLGGDQL